MNRFEEEKKLMKEIINSIGEPALLEQCAEECTELAKACLKMARIMRGENPTPKTKSEATDELVEEVVDVCICVDSLAHAGIVDKDYIIGMDLYDKKLQRWHGRIFGAHKGAGNANE